MTDSSLWKEIVKNIPIVMSAGIWNIGDRRHTYDWEDNWLEIGRNLLDYQINVLAALENARVCDLLDASGNWN